MQIIWQKKVKFHPNRTTMCTSFQRTLYIAINNNNKYFNLNYETLKTIFRLFADGRPQHRASVGRRCYMYIK